MTFKVFSGVTELKPQAWNQLVSRDFPFHEHAFLSALEVSGCVGQERGWEPLILTAWRDDVLIGAMPLYEKNDSYGEYIFDWQWAALIEQARLPYYPKIVSAIPFTPATGPKFLVHPQAQGGEVQAALIRQAQSLVRERGAHSLHALFTVADEQAIFAKAKFNLRETHQFHWQNRGYRDFKDFLAALVRRKRQNILRERAAIEAQGLRIECYCGEALLPEHAEWMYGFYRQTIAKRGSQAYLTAAFFREIFKTFRERIVFFTAFAGEECVAGSLLFQKGQALFGRYWGARAAYANLHFEMCYYRGIELAIARGWQRFEAGAQGPHKIARGFLPAYTYSAHWFVDSRLHAAIGQIIDDEKRALHRGMQAFQPDSPYKA